MAFEHPFTARFHEVDRVGITFFGRAFEYAHVCLEELLTAGFGRVDRVFTELGVALPIVHAEADYSAPIRHGDRLVARVTVAAVGGRSVTFRYALCGREDPDDLRVVVRLVHACVRLSDFAPAELPAALFDGLRPLGVLPDEAAE